MTPLAAPPSAAATRSRPAGLWHSTTTSAAARDLGAGLGDLAAELLDERLGARAEEVVDEHGVAPAARQRDRHVARPDEPDLHGREYEGALARAAGAATAVTTG